jgi:hypothetical protein
MTSTKGKRLFIRLKVRSLKKKVHSMATREQRKPSRMAFEGKLMAIDKKFRPRGASPLVEEWVEGTKNSFKIGRFRFYVSTLPLPLS